MKPQCTFVLFELGKATGIAKVHSISKIIKPVYFYQRLLQVRPDIQIRTNRSAGAGYKYW